ncbi:hypothetical protein CHUAL_010998 [Chamberlinius hualienensis]
MSSDNLLESWEDFYRKNASPENYEEDRRRVKEFCERHFTANNRIILVTSPWLLESILINYTRKERNSKRLENPNIVDIKNSSTI